MDLALNNKVALVTGSNRGTGRIIADQLQAEGATVLFHSLHASEKIVTNQIERAHSVSGDISTEPGCEELIASISELGLAPNILVNNYGTALPGKWQTLSSGDWVDAYQKNTLSVVRLCNAFSPSMAAAGFGRIVNLGTIGSTRPNDRMPHYYAAKGALANLTVSLAKELKGSGVTVNLVSPGLIRTPEVEAHYLERAIQAGWGDTWEAAEAQITEHYNPNLIGRMATREEVASVVTFLCGQAASFLTAQNIRVDGGSLDIV
jgi:NAD(P)-dependent dehydrogenase (short-subunit alcohol dehydrogenase family)